jgi:hypothetical protein
MKPTHPVGSGACGVRAAEIGGGLALVPDMAVSLLVNVTDTPSLTDALLPVLILAG